MEYIKWKENMSDKETIEYLKSHIKKQKKEIKILKIKNNVLNSYNKMNIADDKKRRELIDFFTEQELEFNRLSGISAIMHWSYKYQRLVSDEVMEDIKEEEQEYRDRHNKALGGQDD